MSERQTHAAFLRALLAGSRDPRLVRDAGRQLRRLARKGNGGRR